METLRGDDVLKRIEAYNSNIYVVMVSSQDQVKPVLDTIKYGAFAFVQKDIENEEEIKNVLANIIAHKSNKEESKSISFKSIFNRD